MSRTLQKCTSCNGTLCTRQKKRNYLKLHIKVLLPFLVISASYVFLSCTENGTTQVPHTEIIKLDGGGTKTSTYMITCPRCNGEGYIEPGSES